MDKAQKTNEAQTLAKITDPKNIKVLSFRHVNGKMFNGCPEDPVYLITTLDGFAIELTWRSSMQHDDWAVKINGVYAITVSVDSRTDIAKQIRHNMCEIEHRAMRATLKIFNELGE